MKNEIKSNYADYFYQNGFEVRFYDNNPVDQNIKKNRKGDSSYELLIKTEGAEYKYNIRKSENPIFYSKNRASLFIFCLKTNVFLALVEGVLKTYNA